MGLHGNTVSKYHFPRHTIPSPECTHLEILFPLSVLQLYGIYLFIPAIKKFLEQAKAFPSLTASDLVADYCRSSVECEEIYKLLEGKRKVTEVFIVVHYVKLYVKCKLIIFND